MSKFKVGDAVYRKHTLFNGTFKLKIPYIVKDVSQHGSIQIEGVPNWWSQTYFELVSVDHNVPINPADTPVTSMIKSESISPCNCGGLTTYKTMSPEAHSRWCKSITGDL